MATEAARIIRDLIKEVRRNINNHESLDPFFFDHFNRRSEKNQRKNIQHGLILIPPTWKNVD
jgi:hypothetical protein